MPRSKLCYLVLAHDDPEHLVRLLSTLDPEATKLVHFDAKYLAPLPEIGHLNARYLKRRRRTFWGAFSLVDATLDLLDAALSQTVAERLVLLSGACFPLKSNDEIERFFDEHSDSEFIRCFYLDQGSRKYQSKLDYFWFPEDRIEWAYSLVGSRGLRYVARAISKLGRYSLPKRRRTVTYRAAFGSQWWSLTRACAAHVLSIHRSNGALRHLFKYTLAPDEMYIHTIVANSPFKAKIAPEIGYVGDGTFTMANLHLIHPSLQKFFTLDDFDDIISSEKLFLRKVRSRDGRELCNRLEQIGKLRHSRQTPDIHDGNCAQTIMQGLVSIASKGTLHG